MCSAEPTVSGSWRGKKPGTAHLERLGLLMNVPLPHVTIQICNFIIRGDFLKGCPSVSSKAVRPDGARRWASVTMFHLHSTVAQ